MARARQVAQAGVVVARSQVFGVAVGLVAGLLVAGLALPSHRTVRVVGVAPKGAAAGDATAPSGDVTAASGPAPGGATPTTAATGGASAAPGASGPAAATPDAQAGAAPGAPAGNGGATAQGVTATSVKVGISMFDPGAFRYLGDIANVGDIKQQWEAIIDQWHRDHLLPLNGRDLTPIFRTHQIGTGGGDPASERSTCTAFANDDKVFMVIGVAFYTTGADCVGSEYHLPILVDTGISEEKFARNSPYLFSIAPSLSRLLRNFVHWADVNHDLAGHKIGIYTLNDAETQDLFNKNVVGEMAKLGSKPAAQATTDNNQGGPNDAIAVQQFRAAGVDTVMLFAAAGGFSQQAESQGYHPKYITTDFNYETADTYAGLMPADQFDSASAMTGRRDGEGASGAKEDDKQESCLKNYERYSGRQIARHSPNKSDPVEYRQILETCDEAEILIESLQAAGPNLTKASWIHAMETAFVNWSSRDFPPVTWSSTQHDGVQQQRTLMGHSSCNCWQAYGDLQPFWVP